MRVCTRCDLSGDRYISRLFDKETDGQVFMEYDALGGFCLIQMVDDEYWNKYSEGRNSLIKK